MKTTGIQSLRKELDQKAIEIANMALLNEQCQQEKAALEGDLKRVLKDNDALEDRIDGLENDQPHAKYRRERALREQAERERDAIRELMNVYNLGGWTDALGPMQRALEAEATTRRLRAALEQVRGLYLPPTVCQMIDAALAVTPEGQPDYLKTNVPNGLMTNPGDENY